MGEKESSQEADWRAILDRLRAEGKAPPRPIADDDTAEIRESAEDGVLRRDRLPREAELTLEQLAPVKPRWSEEHLLLSWVFFGLLIFIPVALIAGFIFFATQYEPWQEPEGVGLGLECRGSKPAEKHEYYVGVELSYEEATWFCEACPNWPWRDDWYECGQRALGLR
jgi:hypothetical protein